MTLLLLEVPDETAIEVLQQYQGFRVVGIVSQPATPTGEVAVPPPVKRKWAGSIPATSAAAWDKHLQEIRNEWERDI